MYNYDYLGTQLLKEYKASISQVSEPEIWNPPCSTDCSEDVGME